MLIRQSVLILLLIMSLGLGSGTQGYAKEPSIHVHLDSHHISPKSGTPEEKITVDTADPAKINPNDPNKVNKTDNPSANPSDISSNEGGSGNDGTFPGGTTLPNGAKQGGSNDPRGGTRDPGANVSGTKSPGVNPGKADSNNVHPGDAKPGEAQPQKHKTPWYKSLWNHTKQALKGGLAGAIGAGIVIGLVLIGAAILGVTIGVPLLITAAVVGILAGAIYGIMAGDQFSWIKGIGIGGMAALTVISIGELGIAAAFRGAVQLFRSAGMRGALRVLGGRSLVFLRGALGGLRTFGRGLLKTPLSTLKSAVFNRFFGTTFGINLGANYLGSMAATGNIPDTKETVKILAESFVSTLIIDRIFRFKFPTGKSALGTGDVGNLKSVKDIADFRSRIPKNATKLPWQKVPGGAEKGVKYRWTDSNGDVYNARAHSPDPSAPAGSNASKGWIYRVEVRYGGGGKTYYMDSKGNFHPQNVMKPSSPMYDESIANDTHIPFTK